MWNSVPSVYQVFWSGLICSVWFFSLFFQCLDKLFLITFGNCWNCHLFFNLWVFREIYTIRFIAQKFSRSKISTMLLKSTKKILNTIRKNKFAMKLSHIKLSYSYYNHLYFRKIFQNFCNRFEDIPKIKDLLVLQNFLIFANISYFWCPFSVLRESLI